MDKELEKFKIIDFLGITQNRYYVSNYGKVYDQQIDSLLNIKIERGFNEVELFTDYLTKKKPFRVDLLVAMAFIQKTQEDIERHRDFIIHQNKNNNDDYYKNLEWCNILQQTIHNNNIF